MYSLNNRLYTVVSPFILSFTCHGFSYLWSTMVQKYYMDKSSPQINNPQVLNCLCLSSMMKPRIVLPRRSIASLSSITTLYTFPEGSHLAVILVIESTVLVSQGLWSSKPYFA